MLKENETVNSKWMIQGVRNEKPSAGKLQRIETVNFMRTRGR